MQDYAVVTTYSGEKLGEVVAEAGDYYIVQYGRFLKTRRPLPKKHTVVRESLNEVVTTVSRAEFCGSPLIQDIDSFDPKDADDYYRRWLDE